MNRSWTWPFAVLLCGMSAVATADAPVADAHGIEKLKAAGRYVAVNPATGTARFVRADRSVLPLSAAAQASLAPGRTGDPAARALEFVREHAGVFGLRNPSAELKLAKAKGDRHGWTHLSFQQEHLGVPVFGAILRAHFDGAGALRSVNGTTVAAITVPASPAYGADEAGARAVAALDLPEGANGATPRETRLVVFRTGLVQGIPGDNYLAYEVEVSNGADVREFVYLDAVSGKKLDQITGIHEARNRRGFDGAFAAAAPGPNYPHAPFWLEGDALPSSSVENDNMVIAGAETHAIFANAFGYDSFDGAGATMDAIFNRGWSCPNASWNSVYISFCNGITTDDVTGHEWAHAYTEYTSGLIYQWQPGALNEAYSDVWGETLDMLNSRGLDEPMAPRTEASCTPYQQYAPETHVNAPANLAGQEYPSGTSAFSPVIETPLTADVVRPNDGQGSATDGCCSTTDAANGVCAAGAWVNAADVVGRIVLVDRGSTPAVAGCGFAVKALNAQRMGAAGVIVANIPSSASPTVPPAMGGASPAEAVTIPTVSMNLADGDKLRAELGAAVTVNVTLQPAPPGAFEDSTRWMMGEESTAVGLTKALRDMWNPNCGGDPMRVLDPIYHCATTDSGGVHINSGVINKMYAQLVDGGTYNGQAVGAIGLTKAAHIFWRAQSAYLVPVSDFKDFADAAEASCSDLVGQDLSKLSTTAGDIGFSGESITAADCAQVTKAIAAVQLRTTPACVFTPKLSKAAFDACPVGPATPVFAADFEGDVSGWLRSHHAATVIPRDWEQVDDVPVGTNAPQDARIADRAFFATNQDPLNNCTQDATGLLYLESPPIVVPASGIAPRLSFEHYVATENGWDGGNVKISVNGGPWTLLTAGTAAGPNRWLFNGHTTFPVGPAAGSTNPLGANCNSTADPLCQTFWSGTDGGSVEGSWGRSIANLNGLAAPGDTIRLRFDFGSDFCTGRDGWYVDDVTVYQCNTTSGLSIDDVTVTEGNSGTSSATFTVTLGQALTSSFTVPFATAAGSATAPSDYTTTSGTLTFAAGTTTRTITVPVVGDTVAESAVETFAVNLGAPSNNNVVVSDGSGTGTIRDNDFGIGVATVSIADASVDEGDSGTANATFVVTLSQPVGVAVSVDYATGDGTAVAPGDYAAGSGTVTFAWGETTKTVTVPVTGDIMKEGDETFTVTLGNVSGGGASIADGVATGTIVDGVDCRVDSGNGKRRGDEHHPDGLCEVRRP
jgi:Zn-dependent metalloprotease